MIANSWDQLLRNALTERLSRIGFNEESPLAFTRSGEHCIDILNFEGQINGAGYKFTCYIGIRFPEIEALLKPNEQDLTYPTVSTPIHFLRDDREYYEWVVIDAGNLDSVVEHAVNEVRHLAEKCFIHFSSLQNVEEELASPIATQVFGFGPFQTTSVRAAIALHQGRPADARKLIAEALDRTRTASMGQRRRLQQLQTQLFPDK